MGIVCALLFSQLSFHTLVGGGRVVFLGALLASRCWVSSLCLTSHPRLCWGRTRNLLQKSLSTCTSSNPAFPPGPTASSVVLLQHPTSIPTETGDARSRRPHGTYGLFIFLGSRQRRGIFSSACGNKSKLITGPFPSCFNSSEQAPVTSC